MVDEFKRFIKCFELLEDKKKQAVLRFLEVLFEPDLEAIFCFSHPNLPENRENALMVINCSLRSAMGLLELTKIALSNPMIGEIVGENIH